ncbi:hypothetical protein [Streptomyces sp. YIM 121038]|uniref:hypothetical protein n=1 Tax=Streptomyces sp. YIM 121038 TaxID=2136401 RepID=UPI00111052F1|nr:hypothetical protein [Streptomyces sp. YIM 121038]
MHIRPGGSYRLHVEGEGALADQEKFQVETPEVAWSCPCGAGGSFAPKDRWTGRALYDGYASKKEARLAHPSTDGAIGCGFEPGSTAAKAMAEITAYREHKGVCTGQPVISRQAVAA